MLLCEISNRLLVPDDLLLWRTVAVTVFIFTTSHTTLLMYIYVESPSCRNGHAILSIVQLI